LKNTQVVLHLDTGRERRTGPLVQWFLEQRERPEFATMVEDRLLPVHNAVLRAWREADAAAFWPALARISAIQLAELAPMIPQNLQGLWKETLAEEKIFLKLCGAGGGGFVLGFARRRADLEALAVRRRLVFPFEGHGAVAD
jgi:mevalonate kinase